MKTDHGIPDCQLYTVITALRGPDRRESINWVEENGTEPPLYTLKRVLTTRLRSILFESEYCYGLYNDIPFQLKDLKSVEVALKQCEKRDLHFLEHLLCAVEVTFNHPVWGEYAPLIVAHLAQKRAEI